MKHAEPCMIGGRGRVSQATTYETCGSQSGGTGRGIEGRWRLVGAGLGDGGERAVAGDGGHEGPTSTC